MNEIVCASGVGLLMDYLEGVLSPQQRAAVDAHVAECPRCLAFITSYRETPRILRQATEVTLPAEVQTSLKSFLRELRGVAGT